MAPYADDYYGLTGLNAQLGSEDFPQGVGWVQLLGSISEVSDSSRMEMQGNLPRIEEEMMPDVVSNGDASVGFSKYTIVRGRDARDLVFIRISAACSQEDAS